MQTGKLQHKNTRNIKRQVSTRAGKMQDEELKSTSKNDQWSQRHKHVNKWSNQFRTQRRLSNMDVTRFWEMRIEVGKAGTKSRTQIKQELRQWRQESLVSEWSAGKLHCACWLLSFRMKPISYLLSCIKLNLNCIKDLTVNLKCLEENVRKTFQNTSIHEGFWNDITPLQICQKLILHKVWLLKKL